jgi:hypothetical protein
MLFSQDVLTYQLPRYLKNLANVTRSSLLPLLHQFSELGAETMLAADSSSFVWHNMSAQDIQRNGCFSKSTCILVAKVLSQDVIGSSVLPLLHLFQSWELKL